MSSEPSGNIVFDTGALLEIVSGSELGAYAKRLLQSGAVLAFTSELNVGELLYLICRKVGEKKSEETVKNLTQSGYVRVSPVSSFVKEAGRIKCVRSIAFADCFALAMGESMRVPVLFASPESELVREIKREPFKTEVMFLSALAKS
ncbi:MAG: PIN domain-containing protein [Nitrososphaerota archaeon]|nr:PIN domain-containing protein [Nitrososphaerota archaeon]